MATIQKATLVGNVLEVSVEVDQIGFDGQPSKGVTARTIYGEAAIVAHMEDADLAAIAGAKLPKAGKDAIVKFQADIAAAKAAAVTE